MTDLMPDPVGRALREGVAHVAAQTTAPPWPLVAERHTRRNKQRVRRISLATGAALAVAAIAVAAVVAAGVLATALFEGVQAWALHSGLGAARFE